MIFVLNGRWLRVLCICIFCEIFHGQWWNRLWFPFWAISNSLVFSFRESPGSACRTISVCRFCIKFDVPMIFGMPIVLLNESSGPWFGWPTHFNKLWQQAVWSTEEFQSAEPEPGSDLWFLIQSTKLFRSDEPDPNLILCDFLVDSWIKMMYWFCGYSGNINDLQIMRNVFEMISKRCLEKNAWFAKVLKRISVVLRTERPKLLTSRIGTIDTPRWSRVSCLGWGLWYS